MEEVVIPFTLEDYGTTIQIIVQYANELIEDDDGEDHIHPSWPLIMKFFRSMHGVDLKPRPRDNSPLAVMPAEAHPANN